jgi:integrating conjugative element membrane protein (TIGR03747 family)
MLITNLLKTLLHGLGWLLLVGFFMLIGGSASQWFFGQRAVLIYSQQLLNHDIKVVSEQLSKPLLIQSIESKFSDNQWQLPSLSKDLVSLRELEASTQTISRLKMMIKPCALRLKISQQIFLTLLHFSILRLIVILLFLPLLGLLSFVGLVDGLTQRHLRKLQGARESSVLYQHTRECLAPSFLVSTGLYMGLPISINPSLWFLVFALLFSLLLSIAARTYKKYL